MGLLKRIFNKSPQQSHDDIDLNIGYDREGKPVIWDYQSEHHCFFVGNSRDCYKAIAHIKTFVRSHTSEWDYIEIYTPTHEELRKNTKGTPEKIKFLLEDIDSMFLEIRSRYETDNPGEKDKSIILAINQASLFGMEKQNWETEYPLVPYKAAQVLHKKLETLMQRALAYDLHIILLDDYFHDYEYLIDRYSLDFGIEADEEGNFHKVTVR